MHCRVRITRACPRLSDYAAVLRGCRIELDGEVLSDVQSARSAYEMEVRRRTVYGHSTGLGALQGVRVTPDPLTLLNEHAAGHGGYLDPQAARLVVFVRAVQLSRGASPVRPVVVERLVEMLNRGIVPAMPIYGSVGASGDLAPLAHLALALAGRGKVFYRGALVEASRALASEGLEPLELAAGEALSLINGTAFSTALLVLAGIKALALVDTLVELAALGVSLATCNPEHYERSSYLKKHELPRTWAARLEQASRGAQRADCGGALQDPYSMRCLPNVLSALYTAWRYAMSVAVCEACSPSDNPVIVGGSIRHQCGFHGIHVALAADHLAQALAAMANACERLIAQLLEAGPAGRFLGDDLSPHGLMMLHYTSAALTTRVRHLASPASVHNIVTSGGQEDLVPMSAYAALRLLDQLEAMEVLVAALAVVVYRLAYLRGAELRGGPAVDKLGKVPVSELLDEGLRLVRSRVRGLL